MARYPRSDYPASLDKAREDWNGDEPPATGLWEQDVVDWDADGNPVYEDVAIHYDSIDPHVVYRMLDPGDARDAWELVKIDGMTQAQAAAELGTTQGTVSRRIGEARRQYHALYAIAGGSTRTVSDGRQVEADPRVRSTLDLVWDGELGSDHYVEAGPVNGTRPPYKKTQLARARRKTRPLPPEERDADGKIIREGAKRLFDRALRVAERRYDPTPVGYGIRDRGADPAGRGPDEELLRYSGLAWRKLCPTCHDEDRGFDKPRRREWPKSLKTGLRVETCPACGKPATRFSRGRVGGGGFDRCMECRGIGPRLREQRVGVEYGEADLDQDDAIDAVSMYA